VTRSCGRLAILIALGAVAAAMAVGGAPAAAQTTRVPLVTSVTTISPLVALIAGVLILILPRLLNYIVALYLIVVGVVGLFGR
jgi:hypothetical protein